MAAPACSPPRPDAADSTTADPQSVVRRDSSGGSAATGQWVVSVHGIGPIRAGMTLDEARAAAGRPLEPLGMTEDPDACHYARLGGAPAGVSFMIEHGRVARVEVDSAGVRTAAGAGVGDTEQRVEQLYDGRVAVTPHKYTSGHYLTVSPSAPADSVYRIVFETDGRVVTQYRAGIRPAVEYVEGCS